MHWNSGGRSGKFDPYEISTHCET